MQRATSLVGVGVGVEVHRSASSHHLHHRAAAQQKKKEAKGRPQEMRERSLERRLRERRPPKPQVCVAVLRCACRIEYYHRSRCAADQTIIMVFNGAEAFKGGASAPSLEREVSGKWSHLSNK